MEITIDELLQGKATRIKKNEYFPTRAYVEPFLERVSKVTDKFIIKVETPVNHEFLIVFPFYHYQKLRFLYKFDNSPYQLF